jgi:hypothetical protein
MRSHRLDLYKGATRDADMLVESRRGFEDFSGNSFLKCSPGQRNSSVDFLLIQQGSLRGRGMFSLVSAVICYIDIAEKHGLVPVVDFQNFPTIYNDEDIKFSQNSWEYYFEQLSNVSLKEVYESQNVFLTSSKYPVNYDYSLTNISSAYAAYTKRVTIKRGILGPDPIGANHSKVLGVHYRGQEMRVARGHWFPPSADQIRSAIDLMFSRDGYERLFLVTEDLDLLEEVVRRYGDIVSYSDSYRTRGWNAYTKKCRRQHFYNLGREVINDAIWLSRCGGIVHCSSNVAEFARFVNHGQYRSEIFINNGPNSRVYPIHKILWWIKDTIPAALGGFSLTEDVINYRSNVASANALARRVFEQGGSVIVEDNK